MSAMASQITSLTIVYSSVYSGADQRKHQSSASLAFVRGIHQWPVNSPHKRPVSRQMFPFDDAIMLRHDSEGILKGMSKIDQYLTTTKHKVLIVLKITTATMCKGLSIWYMATCARCSIFQFKITLRFSIRLYSASITIILIRLLCHILWIK